MYSDTAAVVVKIKKINYVCSYNFNTDPKNNTMNNSCNICKQLVIFPPLDELNNTNKKIKINGKLIKGKCGDIFHESCILNYIGLGYISCPTCNVPWEQLKTLRSGVLISDHNQLSIKKK